MVVFKHFTTLHTDLFPFRIKVIIFGRFIIVKENELDRLPF